jgi:hypothetical protein
MKNKPEMTLEALARQIQHDIYEGFYDEGATGLIEFEIPAPCMETINRLSLGLAERTGVSQQAARNALTKMAIDDYFEHHTVEEIVKMFKSAAQK